MRRFLFSLTRPSYICSERNMREYGLAGSSSNRETLAKEISLKVPPDLGACFLIRVMLDVMFVLKSRISIHIAAIQPSFFLIYLSSNNKKLSRLKQLNGKFYAIFDFPVNQLIINNLERYFDGNAIFIVNIIYRFIIIVSTRSPIPNPKMNLKRMDKANPPHPFIKV